MNYIEALLLSFILYFLLIWLITYFNLGPRLKKREPNKILFAISIISLSIFFIFSILSAVSYQRNVYWIYSIGITIFILVISIFTLEKNINIVRFSTLLLFLLVITLSLIINGSVPLGSDEGRYVGFAYRIIQDGRWTPFQYSENVYYQFFHVLPSLIAILSMIANIDPIHKTYPLLILYQAVIMAITVFALVKRMFMNTTKRKFNYLVFIILLTAPPISPLALLPRNVAVVLYLLILLLCIVSLNKRNGSLIYIIPIFLIISVGVLSHAIFTILTLISLTFILILIKLHRVNFVQTSFLEWTLKIVTLNSIIYWTYTLIMNSIIIAGVSSMYNSFIDLFSGGMVSSGGTEPWYNSGPSELALSWAFLPAITTTFIIKELIYRNKRISWRESYYTGLGFAGLLLLLSAFILRIASAGFYGYFYYAYFLLIPASIKLVSEMAQKNRVVPTAIMIGLIVVSAFYGIQDPAYSPDIYKILPAANERSWSVAETLSQYLSQHIDVIGGPISGKNFYSDERVAIGFSTLMLKVSFPFEENASKNETLFVVGSDSLGIMWAQRHLPTMEFDRFNKVFSDDLYNAYVVEKN